MIQWIIENWAEVAKAIAYIIAGVSVIVKITPTPKDDTILKKIKDFLSRFIALNP